GRTDFAGLARAAGIRRVYSCDRVEQWRGIATEALSPPGPVAIWLKVAARPDQRAPRAMRPMAEQIGRLRPVLEQARPAVNPLGAGERRGPGPNSRRTK